MSWASFYNLNQAAESSKPHFALSFRGLFAGWKNRDKQPYPKALHPFLYYVYHLCMNIYGTCMHRRAGEKIVYLDHAWPHVSSCYMKIRNQHMLSSVPALVATWRYHTLTSFDHDLCERSVNMLHGGWWNCATHAENEVEGPSWIFMLNSSTVLVWCYSPNLICGFQQKHQSWCFHMCPSRSLVVFWFFSNTRILSHMGDPSYPAILKILGF